MEVDVECPHCGHYNNVEIDCFVYIGGETNIYHCDECENSFYFTLNTTVRVDKVFV